MQNVWKSFECRICQAKKKHLDALNRTPAAFSLTFFLHWQNDQQKWGPSFACSCGVVFGSSDILGFSIWQMFASQKGLNGVVCKYCRLKLRVLIGDDDQLFFRQDLASGSCPTDSGEKTVPFFKAFKIQMLKNIFQTFPKCLKTLRSDIFFTLGPSCLRFLPELRTWTSSARFCARRASNYKIHNVMWGHFDS